MPAPWKHVFPPESIGQIQAIKAKKHITVFVRSPSAPGAGSPEQKAKFSRCAKTTKGIPDRLDRNARMRACLIGGGPK